MQDQTGRAQHCYVYHKFAMPLFQMCCSEIRMKYVDRPSIGNVLGRNVCQELPGMHAITGCDTVSSFAGKGKLSAFKLVKKNVSFQELIVRLGFSWEFSDADFTKLQMFTCSLYGAKKSESYVNTHRYQLFCSKQASIEGHKLPPCADCLYKHCQRACYQTAVWKRALDAKPEIPSPIGKACIQDKGDATDLAIDWMQGLPALDAVLELMSCSCILVCKGPQCKCIANGLHCTEMCRLTSSSNIQSDEEPEAVVDN